MSVVVLWIHIQLFSYFLFILIFELKNLTGVRERGFRKLYCGVIFGYSLTFVYFDFRAKKIDRNQTWLKFANAVDNTFSSHLVILHTRYQF